MTNREFQRKQMRELKKKGRKEGLTDTQIAMAASIHAANEKIREKRKNKDVAMALSFAYPALGLALHDLYGFGGKRIQDVFTGMNKYLDMLQNGRATTKDLLQRLKKETGVELGFDWFWEDDSFLQDGN